MFIGSDTQLLAPVTVRRGAYVGAGSTITKEVPAISLALTRAELRIVKDWVLRRRTERSAAGEKTKPAVRAVARRRSRPRD